MRGGGGGGGKLPLPYSPVTSFSVLFDPPCKSPEAFNPQINIFAILSFFHLFLDLICSRLTTSYAFQGNFVIVFYEVIFLAAFKTFCLPILIGIDLDLWKEKNQVTKQTTLHSSTCSLNITHFQHPHVYHMVKFLVLCFSLGDCELLRWSSLHGSFPAVLKNSKVY